MMATIEDIRELARVIHADENAYRSLDDSAEFTWSQAIAAAKEQLRFQKDVRKLVDHEVIKKLDRLEPSR